MQTLVEQFTHAAATWPARLALVDPAGVRLTYEELDALSGRFARFLVARGVAPGDRVGLITPKCADGIAAMLGILKAGAAYVPADYSAPADRNRSILADGEVRLAVLDHAVQDLADGLESVLATVILGGSAAGDHVSWAEAVAGDALVRPVPRTIDDLAYILYTSGSTGVPKGVMLSHRNAVSFVDWCTREFAPSHEDRFSNHAPWHFDLSVLDIFVAFKHGAALFLVGEALGKDPKALAAFIADQRLTMWYSTPSILTLLAQFGDLGAHDYGALRTVFFAGEVFPVKHLRHITSLWPHPAYFNLYGPTETNVCTFARIPLPVPEARTQPYPIGWACSHCDALVLDESGAVVPEGDEGLLYIAGDSVFLGYRNRPEQNAKAFIEREGRRWYNTGDVVRLDPAEGYIYVGRRDRMVKRRGYRIELGEIERGLYQHPQLGEVAVVSVSDETGVRIAAFLAAKDGAKPSIIELKAYCARQLPSYMSPDVFRFLDALPRTSTNKVDYQQLTRLAAGR